jgi:drug/metabolite transporter (DMT)-like permease
MNKLVWALPLLFFSVCVASSAASAFQLIDGVSGSMKAAWRLQIAAYAMLVVQSYDWMTQRDACCRMWRQELSQVVISGLIFGAFFSMFAISLQLTSMAHCLVLLNCCPIALILHSLAKKKPVYKWEAIGVAVSLVGMLLVVLDIDTQHTQATWFGDLLALAAMVVCVAYVIHMQFLLRERKVPQFAFFCPVNVIASLTAYLFACCAGEGDLYFAWSSPEYLLPVLYVGLAPGVVGQLLINFLSVHVSVLLIGVFMNLEPFFGGFLGWAFDLQTNPSLLLWLGGFITIAGNTIVTLYGNDAEEAKRPHTDHAESELTRQLN